MDSRLPRVAVDTCVILDFLMGQDPDRARRSQWLLSGHQERHMLVLPAIVIAELTGSGLVRGDDGGKAARSQRISHVNAWIVASKFLVAELSERTALRASALAVDHNLKGADAAVLATAIDWGCDVLFTRDGALLNSSGLSMSVREPEEPTPAELELIDRSGELAAEAIAEPRVAEKVS